MRPHLTSTGGPEPVPGRSWTSAGAVLNQFQSRPDRRRTSTHSPSPAPNAPTSGRGPTSDLLGSSGPPWAWSPGSSTPPWRRKTIAA